ncbi:MAG: glycoside hydrolase family 15 protein [Planctomycetes bacterium]|nr:glycoside hydrolase family 15 protein [Planctomycetota bacterium]
MPLPIEDYALVGDCQSAALVGRDGSVDWLCLPRFDSEACFAALLGTPQNGRWLIQPREEIREVTRRYRDETLILETTVRTDGGEATLVDFMPIRSDVPDLVRIVAGVRGRVRMRMELIIRHDTGAMFPWIQRVEDGIIAVAGADALHLQSGVELSGECDLAAEFDVKEGQRVPFVLTWYPSYRERPEAIDPEQALEENERWWRDWSSRCRCESRWRKAVVRSLITLKALTYSPSGGIAAAPTTSLPENLGGGRNWDYRYCWLRDATFTLCALMNAGYLDEAKAWRQWLLRAVAGDPRRVQPLYTLTGERQILEREAEWLPGYEESRPVRLGNGACRQRQLDIFGAVIDALYIARKHNLAGSDHAWSIQQALVEHLEEIWHEPDRGIWEMRGKSLNFTHSKVMAWVALDRAIKALEASGRKGPLARWKKLRRRIHEEVCQRAFDEELNSFTQAYEHREIDAATLLIPLVGFLPPDDSRVRGTIAAVEERLITKDGFIARYDTRSGVDGLPPGEGAFLMCTFWLADNYALGGREAEARELFERLLETANDVGLMAEEYDPHSGRFLGNFPQAFSHVSLVNTAGNLAAGGGGTQVRREP